MSFELKKDLFGFKENFWTPKIGDTLKLVYFIWHSTVAYNNILHYDNLLLDKNLVLNQ